HLILGHLDGPAARISSEPTTGKDGFVGFTPRRHHTILEEAAVSGLDSVQSWLGDRLATVARDHKVPGAAVAVLAGHEVVDAATGVLSTSTGVDATTDSVFQVGSITKLWTATLVMQLVDEGLLDLD